MTIRTTIPRPRRWALAAAIVLMGIASSTVRAAADESTTPARIERVRYSADGSSTRVIVILSRQVPYEVALLPGAEGRGSKARLVVDFSNARLGSDAAKPIGVEDGLLQRIRTGQFTARTARVVLDLGSVTSHSISELTDPPRVVIDIAGHPAPESAESPLARGDRDGTAATTHGPSPARGEGVASAEHDARATIAGASTDRERRESAGDETASTARARVEPPRRDGIGGHARAEASRNGDTAEATGRAEGAEGSRDQHRGADGDAARANRLHDDSAPSVGNDDLAGAIRNAKPKPDALASAGATRADDSARTGGEERTAALEHRSDEPARTQREDTAPAERRDVPDKHARHGEAPPTIRRIVLDPGHGGIDPGAQGVDGVLEKDVTLAIAKRLKRRLEDGLHAEVVLTRTSDITRSLAERTAFANARGADLFISIHTNADVAGRLHGIETYTLNNSDDHATVRLAKMENGPAFRTPRGNLSFILSDLVQSGKEEESNALAERLQYRMLSRLRNHYPDVRDLGVKRGPFYVLVGAFMPCVLVETSFLSHPIEGRRLASGEYQAELVEGLYLGVADFFGDARLAKTL